MEQDPFAAIKIRRPKSEVVYLTEEELLRLTISICIYKL
jgi:hypothetical protein